MEYCKIQRNTAEYCGIPSNISFLKLQGISKYLMPLPTEVPK
jgi:hypothetical protein